MLNYSGLDSASVVVSWWLCGDLEGLGKLQRLDSCVIPLWKLLL
jgi:hypothetical protein